MKVLSCNEIVSNFNKYSNDEFNLTIMYEHPLYIIINNKSDEIYKYIHNDQFIKYKIPEKQLSPYEMVAPILYHRYYTIKYLNNNNNIIENNLYEWKKECVHCYIKSFLNASNTFYKNAYIDEYLFCHGIIGLFIYLDESKQEYEEFLNEIIDNVNSRFLDGIYCDFIRLIHLLHVKQYNNKQQIEILEFIARWRNIFDNGINENNVSLQDLIHHYKTNFSSL